MTQAGFYFLVTGNSTENGGEETVIAPTLWRLRLRVRIGKHLDLQAAEHQFQFLDREVKLVARSVGAPINQSEWLVFSARGFVDQSEATAFGSSLKAALHLAGFLTRQGLDPGTDMPSSMFSSTFMEALFRDQEVIGRNDVHGLDVFADDPRVKILQFSAALSVHGSTTLFLSKTIHLGPAVQSLSKASQEVILLMNFALMRPEPVAQIVFAISAVEMLGQQESWSEQQRRLLDSLEEAALTSDLASEQERKELADAVRRVHPISLRQGAFRLMERLGLAGLKKPWDELYAERSKLVHGLAPQPGVSYAALADRAVNLCGRILLTSVGQELPSILEDIDLNYPLPS